MLLLVFAIVLLLAVLLSRPAQHSVLSTAVLFLVAGFVLGSGGFGLIELQPRNPIVSQFTELALFSVLFGDGMRFNLHEIKAVWKLPGRALLFGMPLTLFGVALLAWLLAGLSWLEALLIGAVLSPTDPVFASAIVSRTEVPSRLRRLLNVESGLNDGLALPAIMLLLNVIGSGEKTVGDTLIELALGVAIGVLVPWLAVRLAHDRFLPPAGIYAPLNAFAIGLLVLALAELLHANPFFAAFSAGVTIVTTCPSVRDAFEKFGESISELLKLAVLLIFGAVISREALGAIGIEGYVFALLAIVAVRPLAIVVALFRSGLPWREQAVVAWFGPKGFASIFYSLLIWKAGVPHGAHLFHLAAVVIALSIVAHSSTDVVIARWVSQAAHTSGHEAPGAIAEKR